MCADSIIGSTYEDLLSFGKIIYQTTFYITVNQNNAVQQLLYYFGM